MIYLLDVASMMIGHYTNIFIWFLRTLLPPIPAEMSRGPGQKRDPSDTTGCRAQWFSGDYNVHVLKPIVAGSAFYIEIISKASGISQALASLTVSSWGAMAKHLRYCFKRHSFRKVGICNSQSSVA